MSYIDIKYLRLISSRLRNFKQRKTDLFNFSCPFCGDSKTNTRKARGYVFKNHGKYFFKCHNCPTSGHISILIEEVDPVLYKDYILETFIENGGTPRKEPVRDIAPIRFDKISNRSNENMVVCSKLPLDSPCIRYLQSRKVPPQCYGRIFYASNYRSLVEEVFPKIVTPETVIPEDARLVFPYYNRYNEITALTGRALGNAYIRYSTFKRDSDSVPIFGADVVDPSRTVRIVEGQIDSFFVDNAVATGNSNLLGALHDSRIKDFTFIFDNEPRNKEIIRIMRKVIDMGHRILIWPYLVANLGKDVNAMILSGLGKEEIETIINHYTYSGLRALLEFNRWRKV